MCFFGRRLFKPVLFMTGVVLTVSLVMLIFYSTFLAGNPANWVGWVVLACSILLGLVVGCCFYKLVKIGAFLVAAWGGFSLGLICWAAFFYYTNSNVAMWCFLIGMAIFFGCLALCFFDHVLIIATSIVGSYLTMRAIGTVAGGYPNEFTIIQ